MKKAQKESNVVPAPAATSPVTPRAAIRVNILALVSEGFKVAYKKSLVERVDTSTFSVTYPSRAIAEFDNASQAVDEFLDSLD